VTIEGSPPPAGPAPIRPAPPRRRWLVAVVVAWALFLAGAGAWSAFRDPPTAREQTTVQQALPTVDAAIAEVAAAAGGDVVAAVGGYRAVGGACEITSARDGARYERVVLLFTPPGTEPALLERVADRLPDRYDARVQRTGGRPRAFAADAGDFVTVRGSVGGEGEVRVAADTGCRPLAGAVTEPQPASAEANRAPVQAVLDALKITPREWGVHRVDCPRGGALWTVEAIGAPGAGPASFVDTVRPAPAAPLVARPELYVYRSGPTGLVLRRAGDAVIVSATTGCG
jgi:hypothetical protein